jgi:hypothetical protein
MRVRVCLALLAACLFVVPLVAQDAAKDAAKEFSGPQVGEKVTPFKIRGVLGDDAGKELNLVETAAGKPLLLLFVHEVNRPSVGLARLIGDYAASRKADGLTTGVILLSADATMSEEWVKRASGALPKGVAIGVSTDGAEGPGAYGLNRKVQVTALVAKDNKVTANFALVQPSVQADGPKIAEAIVAAVGGKAPTLEEMQKLGGGAPMRRPQ